ncbi:MAG: hypothetical protein K0U72_05665 [Gammaproteobacteria bacterium]|nr:hypothetical protein [Gammaproteobacteria bacterium]
MKYLISLVLGLVVGAVIFATGVILNPFVESRNLSPISVTDSQTLTLSYSAVAANSIVHTNNGESRILPHPEKVLQLWEAPIRQTSAVASLLHDARNQPVGLGIKFSSTSERTRLLNGEALVDSVWYVYLPGRGGFFVEQSENYWTYVRDVVFPAYRSASNAWKGSWLGNVTAGPGALGTARVTGGSGEFQGNIMPAVESLIVRAWSAKTGPVAADGRLTIELPSINPEEQSAQD